MGFQETSRPNGTSVSIQSSHGARGFQQREGIDYTETYSPVVTYDSLRVLLALVAQEDLELVQFDVKTAFLYGKPKRRFSWRFLRGSTVVRK